MTAVLQSLRSTPATFLLPFLAALLGLLSLVSLYAGLPADPQLREVILHSVRLPRWLVACLAGATLAGGGAALQALLRNPLAEPALLGVSAGAALAAVSLLVLASLGGVAALQLAPLLPLAAFLGGLLVVLFVLAVAGRRGRIDVTEVLLVGMAVNLLAGAGVGLLTYIAPAADLRGIVFWALGSLAGIGWRDAVPAALAMTAALLLLLPRRHQLNLLSMGESEAWRMGVPVGGLQRRLIAATALGVGAGVAVAGVIGFVGLLVPHLLRRIAGPDYRRLLPASMLGGAVLLCGADLLARLVIHPAELPVGLLTTLLGAPFFLWLVARGMAARGVA